MDFIFTGSYCFYKWLYKKKKKKKNYTKKKNYKVTHFMNQMTLTCYFTSSECNICADGIIKFPNIPDFTLLH